MLPSRLSNCTVLPLMIEPILLISPIALSCRLPPALSRPALRLLMLFWLSSVSAFCAVSVLPLLVILPAVSETFFPAITLPLLIVTSFGDR
ncbi:hypothetical protein D3C76_1254950 [compost metagenome]